MAAIGSFDSLNPYIIRGEPVAGIGLVYDTLTTQSNDEAFTEYGLLAENIDLPEDRSWVAFELRPQARWHDGMPVTVDDVIFSFDILKTKGTPFYRAYYANVAKRDAGRRASGQVPVRRHRQSRAAADPGPAAGTAEALLGGQGFRALDAGAAAGKWALPDQEHRSRPRGRLRARPRLLGRGHPGEQGPLQFRRDPLRILPRPQRRPGGLQGRAV